MSDERFQELFERVFQNPQETSRDASIIPRNKAAAGFQGRRPQSPRLQARPRKNLRKLFVVCILVALTVGVGSYALGQHGTSSSNPEAAKTRVALVDELSATMPDPSFIKSISNQLSSSGYHVDYYGPVSATVGLFRSLPSLDYGLIIFRAHTAWSQSSGISIITSEPYSTKKYVLEQLTDQLDRAEVTFDSDYFAVSPGFVQNSMQGRLPGSNIIVMGCDGLVGTEMAQAFLDRGASAYVSWNGPVTIHTDTSTLALIQSLVQGQSLQVAVSTATEQAGPDPMTHARMAYYDSSVRAYQQFTGVTTSLSSLLALLALFILGPAVVILIPKILGRR